MNKDVFIIKFLYKTFFNILKNFLKYDEKSKKPHIISALKTIF